ncbi:hypothetical protein CDL12_09430 [Handroanthus impetiginosus]|uniref:CWF21 domain-containing protein n=1 Tax=Handroanthus impetiginosus TaxID=429701 RepID=A0A2G9HK67_9LAMI|nr:hypothetical protein CDL12_09430 [Handroanthus impetiginosus]
MIETDLGRVPGRVSYIEDDIQSEGRGLPATDHTPEAVLRSSEIKNEPGVPSSKWAREDDESDDRYDRSARHLGLSYSSSGSENAGDGHHKSEEQELTADASNSAHLDVGMNEEQRQKLRRPEVALMEYRESLEERGIKSSEEIERKVAIHRSWLQAEYGLLDSNADASGRKMSSSDRRDRRDDSQEPSKKRRSSESSQRKLST